MKIIECVPNISEGRDLRILDAVANAVRAGEDVQLLDVDARAESKAERPNS